MRILRTLVLLVGIQGASSAVAAESATTVPMTAQAVVKRTEAWVATRMEYCLRNVPELTEPLVAAHAIYSRASIEAAAMLERQYPASKLTIQRARVEASRSAAAEFDLRQACSEGFNRVCPQLLTYMVGATGESLAKRHGESLSNLQNQFSSP